MNIDSLQKSLAPGEGYLFVSPQNRFYLTGFAATDGYLFVTGDYAVFMTDSRYIEQAKASVRGCNSVIEGVQYDKELPAVAMKLGIKTLFIETESVTVSQLGRFRRIFEGIEVSPESKADEQMKQLRRCKCSEEKELIVSAQRIAEEAFTSILSFIRPGLSDREVALELDYTMQKLGSEGVSFETIVVSGKESSKPHGVPSPKIIENGDFITMDFGAVVKGYRSDMTRTVAVGSVSGKQKEIYETVLSARKAAFEAMAPGVECRVADKAARDIISAAGYGSRFGHGTGHGVGIDIHEFPSVSPRSKDVLAAGDVVTDEPGIYLPGEFGVRIEDMIFITPGGCENLTKAPKELIIL